MKKLRSKKIENLSQKKSEVEEVRETFWYVFFIESLRIKSIRPANIFTFNFQRDFELNTHTRKEKIFVPSLTQNQGILHISRISRSNFVKSHFTSIRYLGNGWRRPRYALQS